MALSVICFFSTGRIYSGCGGFWYFSFINQLPSYILGIMIYNETNNSENKNCALRTLLLFMTTLVLFYLPTIPLRSVFIPFGFSLSFFYILKALWNKSLVCCNILTKVGKLSYPIFLLHIFFIWDIPTLVLQPFLPLNTTTCIIYGVIAFFVVYFVSRYFNKLIGILTNRLKILFLFDKDICQKKNY